MIIDDLATEALTRYGLSPGATAELCNVSENHTYRVEHPEKGTFALRVHRPGYRTAQQIECELDWVDALREDGAVDTCVPVAAPSGERVVDLGSHNVVLWEWLPGAEPDPEGDEVIDGFRMLGAVSARMHAHARGWRRPAGFDRPVWDFAHTLGEDGYWGLWQDGLGMGAEELALLERLAATIDGRLRAYGQSGERFGLVHADIRLANLLVDDGNVRVIDFDDCGFAWFMYDFATTVSFMEEHPRVPELREAWLEGYRSVAPLDAADEAELDTFVMLRRLLLVAWIGSHHTFATEAAELGAGFTTVTCELAERISRLDRRSQLFTPLTGRTVLVTGGTKGIGKGIARVFAGAGANVALVARGAEAGEAAAAELGATYIQADVGVAADCERMAAQAIARLGGIDVLCANAGVFPDAKLEDMSEQDIDAIFATNVKGTMLSVKACMAALERSGHGRVILTSSITGPITGYPGWCHYGATKAAQLGFLRTAAIELAPKGITINAVMPGNIETEGLDELGPEYRHAMESSIPQKKLGKVEDIGYAALFFATDEAGYITGQTIVVDGGQVLPESPMAMEAM